MSKTRFVAFATQKGGIGKSTITALVANYFHNVKGYNVAVIDCDEPQYNLADLRDEELELIKSSDYFKAQACEHFKKLGKKSFSVTRSNAVNALDDAETVLNETEVKLDFIFFDMPGTIKSEGVMKTLSQMDYIFVPVSADRFVVESAMSFMQLFHDNFLTQGWSVTKKLAFFWTMVDKRERTSLYDVYEVSRLFGSQHTTARQQTFQKRAVGEQKGSVPFHHLSIRPKPVAREWHQGVVRRDL